MTSESGVGEFNPGALRAQVFGRSIAKTFVPRLPR